MRRLSFLKIRRAPEPPVLGCRVTPKIGGGGRWAGRGWGYGSADPGVLGHAQGYLQFDFGALAPVGGPRWAGEAVSGVGGTHLDEKIGVTENR